MQLSMRPITPYTHILTMTLNMVYLKMLSIVIGDSNIQYHDFNNGDALTFKDKYTALWKRMHHYLQVIPPHHVIIKSLMVYKIQTSFWKENQLYQLMGITKPVPVLT